MDDERKITFIDSFKDLEPVEQVKRIARLINSTPTLKKVQVEVNSIGSVYISQLRQLVSNKSIITGFTTTNESKRRIIEQLVTAFNKKQITIPKDNELISELSHYAMEKTSKGYTYNGVAGFHDDYVISLAMCYDLFENETGVYNITFKKKKTKITLAEKYQ